MKIGLNYSFTKKGPGRRHRAPEWLRDARLQLRQLWMLRRSEQVHTRMIETFRGHFVKVSNHDLLFTRRPQ